MYNTYNLDNFEAGFREFLILEKVAPVTLKNYLSDLRHFLGWIVSEFRVRKLEFRIDVIDINFILSYRNYLSQNQIPLKTINRRLSTLRKFFSFCILQGWITKNPTKHITNIALIHTDEKAGNNSLILKTEVIHQPHFSETEILTEYKKCLIDKKLNEKEILQIISDINEFMTIINFRLTAEPFTNL